MSGGSYDYLCYKDVSQLLDSQYTIRDMAERLEMLGYANDVAEETKNLLKSVEDFENKITIQMSKLSQIWRAVEWWDSSDSSEASFKKALAEYRAG